jgi:hypothetical protein
LKEFIFSTTRRNKPRAPQVPTGKVEFVLRRSGIKIAMSVVSLHTAGVARATFLKVRASGTYQVVSVYRGSANFLRFQGTIKIV